MSMSAWAGVSVRSLSGCSSSEWTCRSSNPWRGSPRGVRWGGDSGYIHSSSVEDSSSLSSVVELGVGSRSKELTLKGSGTKIPRIESGKSLPARANNFSRMGRRRLTCCSSPNPSRYWPSKKSSGIGRPSLSSMAPSKCRKTRWRKSISSRVNSSGQSPCGNSWRVAGTLLKVYNSW